MHISNKNDFVIFSLATSVGSKRFVWDVAATARAFVVPEWDVVATAWELKVQSIPGWEKKSDRKISAITLLAWDIISAARKGCCSHCVR